MHLDLAHREGGTRAHKMNHDMGTPATAVAAAVVAAVAAAAAAPHKRMMMTATTTSLSTF